MANYWSPSTEYVPLTLIRAEDYNTDNNGIAASFALLPDEVRINRNTILYELDTGAANAYEVDLGAKITALTDGLRVAMKASAANTGASTLQLTGIGSPVAIVRAAGVALQAGDIAANQIVELRYNTSGPYWQVVSVTTLDEDAADQAAAAAASAAAAEAWAITGEDTLVPASAGGDEISQYSALHYAAKAAAAALQDVFYQHDSGTLTLVASTALTHLVNTGDTGSLVINLPTGTKLNGESVLISKYSGTTDLTVNIPAGETARWVTEDRFSNTSQVAGNHTIAQGLTGQLRYVWDGAEWNVTGVS